MKRASIGFAGVLAAAVLGFLLYRAADRYISENGFDVNLKFVAVAALVSFIAVAVIAVAMRRN